MYLNASISTAFMSWLQEIIQNPIKQKALYSPPQEITIAGIPSVIVDPHNEVFSYWMHHRNAVVVHIDRHSDMGGGAFPRTSMVNQDCKWYGKEMLKIGNFIVAAVDEGAISTIYHSDPSVDSIIAYGRVGTSTPRTRQTMGFLEWDDIAQSTIDDMTMKSDIAHHSGDVILDIDLDGFMCINDHSYKDPHHLENAAHHNEQRFHQVLQSTPRPNYITIARSLTPEVFTPPEFVDALQEKVCDILKHQYDHSSTSNS
jgi:hypothetical protein